jgi:flagellar biogenesis protein FliO
MEYGAVLFRMVLMLAAVCAMAMVTLRWGLRRLVAPPGAGSPVEVVSRTVVEPRRAILVVRVGRRHLVVGSSEAGMQLLAEVTSEELAAGAVAHDLGDTARARRSFREVLGSRRPVDHDNPAEDEANRCDGSPS